GPARSGGRAAGQHPLIDGLPRLHGAQLTAALATARRDYNRRIAEHLTYARTALECRREP
ncbi:MAG TPA: hypothetical protein VFU36_10800, partial [Jatrophihabitans sp.]|nr:hypothetical protein [Jatrophihabitans sp.]